MTFGCKWVQMSQNWCQNINFFVILITFVYVGATLLPTNWCNILMDLKIFILKNLFGTKDVLH
jgi:hypothetical protein